MNYTLPQNNQPQNIHLRSKMSNFPVAVTPLPADPVVAMAYIVFQSDTTTYDEMKALSCGTLFPVLNKPFLGSGVR